MSCQLISLYIYCEVWRQNLVIKKAEQRKNVVVLDCMQMQSLKACSKHHPLLERILSHNRPLMCVYKCYPFLGARFNNGHVPRSLGHEHNLLHTRNMPWIRPYSSFFLGEWRHIKDKGCAVDSNNISAGPLLLANTCHLLVVVPNYSSSNSPTLICCWYLYIYILV